MKNIFTIVLAFFLLSCGIIQQSDHTEEMTVLQKHFSNLDKDEKLHQNTITGISVPTDKTLKEAINLSTLNFHIAANGQPDSIKFDTIFSSSEMAYFKEKISDAKPLRLKQAWFANTALTQKTKNTSGKIKFTTLPVLSPDGRFAIFYAEDYFGGQIYIYRKNTSTGKWEFFSTSSIWMS